MNCAANKRGGLFIGDGLTRWWAAGQPKRCFGRRQSMAA